MAGNVIEIKLNKVDPQHPVIVQAASVIQQGGLVAFPTETVYGLGANARSSAAVARIFEAKGRPQDNPLIVHVSNLTQLQSFVTDVPPTVRKLMDRFWPGPLTILMNAKENGVSERVTAGLSTVAVRMPDHPVALSLIEASGCPIAAPSANRSGRPSPTLARHVADDLGSSVDYILDGGASGIGLESTVISTLEDQVVILRPGGITATELAEVVGDEIVEYTEKAFAERIEATDEGVDPPPSPGMKYKHYAPQGTMVLVASREALADERSAVVQKIQALLAQASERGERTGVLTFDEHVSLYEADQVLSYGRRFHPEEQAHLLYARLREFDDRNITYIVAEAYRSDDGLSKSILNRLTKAAGSRLIEV